MENRFEIISVSSKPGRLTYACDKCFESFDFDKDIVWITSSYGVCEDCRAKISEEEYEELLVKYE